MTISRIEVHHSEAASSSQEYQDEVILRMKPSVLPLTGRTIALYIANCFNLNPYDLQKILPKGTLKTLNQRVKSEIGFLETRNNLLGMMNRSLESRQNWGEKADLLKLEQEFDNEELKIIEIKEDIRCIGDTQINLLSPLLKGILVASGTQTFEELFVKFDQYGYQRALVEREYLSSSENQERRKLIDLTLFKDSDDDVESIMIVTEYWDSLFTQNDGIISFQKGQKLLKTLFTTLKLELKEVGESLVATRESLSKGIQFNLPGKLDVQIQAVSDRLLSRYYSDLANDVPDADPRTVKYFHLLAKKIVCSLTSRTVKKLLKPDYIKVQARFKDSVERYKHMLALKIESRVRMNQFMENYIAEHEAGDSSEGIKQTIENYREDSIENKKALVKLEHRLMTRTDDDWARKKLQEHPSFYPPILEKYKKFPSRWRMIKSYNIICENSLIRSLTNPQILNKPSETEFEMLNDSHQHHLNLIRQLDDELLNLNKAGRKKPQAIMCSIL